MSSTSAYRVRWKRVDWSSGRLKASESFASLRGAQGKVRRILDGGRKHGYAKVDVIYIEEGTILWSPHHIEVDEALIAKQDAPVETSSKLVVTSPSTIIEAYVKAHDLETEDDIPGYLQVKEWGRANGMEWT